MQQVSTEYLLQLIGEYEVRVRLLTQEIENLKKTQEEAKDGDRTNRAGT